MQLDRLLQDSNFPVMFLCLFGQGSSIIINIGLRSVTCHPGILLRVEECGVFTIAIYVIPWL